MKRKRLGFVGSFLAASKSVYSVIFSSIYLPSNVKMLMEKYTLLRLVVPIYYLAWKRKGNKGTDDTFQGCLLWRTKQEGVNSRRGTLCTNLELAMADLFSRASSWGLQHKEAVLSNSVVFCFISIHPRPLVYLFLLQRL